MFKSKFDGLDTFVAVIGALVLALGLIGFANIGQLMLCTDFNICSFEEVQKDN